MSDIQALTFRVQTLGQSVDRWNTAMILALVLTAIAAVAVLATTRIAITQAGKLGEAQRELAVAKEQQLAIDLKDKDIKIGELELARLDLEKQVAPRRLSREDKRKMADSLKQAAPIGIVVASALLDPESSDFADDLNSAIHEAGPNWKTLRLTDRLTKKTGVSLGTFEGTPKLDPWNRPVAILKQRIGDALKAAGVSYNDVTFTEEERHSIGRQFEPGPIYLVIEHKPPIKISK